MLKQIGMVLMMLLPTIIQAQTLAIKLGNNTVYIDIHTQGNGNNFVHLHSNETTALKAAQQVLKQKGGTLITLKHNGGRNISFKLNGKTYRFDPNRMFTAEGRKKSLKKLSHYDKKAAEEITNLSNKVLSLIDNDKAIITAHNNRNYSMKNYYKGGNMQNDAKAVYKNPKRYYRNFFFVTQAKDFHYFKQQGFNVVLQNNAHASDDGSLSVALAKRQYINSEAGYDQLKQQIEMLTAADSYTK